MSAKRACRAYAEVARNETVALAVFPGVCTWKRMSHYFLFEEVHNAASY